MVGFAAALVVDSPSYDGHSFSKGVRKKFLSFVRVVTRAPPLRFQGSFGKPSIVVCYFLAFPQIQILHVLYRRNSKWVSVEEG